MAGEEVSLEQAFGLTTDWRSASRLRRTDEIVARISCGVLSKSARDHAGVIRNMVLEYRRHWDADKKASSRPSGLDGDCFDLLETHGGELPSLSTILRSMGRIQNGSSKPMPWIKRPRMMSGQ